MIVYLPLWTSPDICTDKSAERTSKQRRKEYGKSSLRIIDIRIAHNSESRLNLIAVARLVMSYLFTILEEDRKVNPLGPKHSCGKVGSLEPTMELQGRHSQYSMGRSRKGRV